MKASVSKTGGHLKEFQICLSACGFGTTSDWKHITTCMSWIYHPRRDGFNNALCFLGMKENMEKIRVGD